MRASTVIFLLAATAATPALATPHQPYARSNAAERLLARQSTVPAESDALSIGSIFNIGGDIIDGIDHLFGGNDNTQQQKRDLADLLAKIQIKSQTHRQARGMSDAIARGQDKLHNTKHGRRDFADIYARRLNRKQARDVAELFARQASTAPSTSPSGSSPESAALGLGSVFSIGSTLIDGLSHFFGGSNNKREVIELLARSGSTDPESDALSLGSIFSIGSTLVDGISHLFGDNNKRELMELLARDATNTNTAALTVDPESGALNLGSIISIGSTLIDGFSHLFGGNDKREMAEVFAREFVKSANAKRAMIARSLNELE